LKNHNLVSTEPNKPVLLAQVISLFIKGISEKSKTKCECLINSKNQSYPEDKAENIKEEFLNEFVKQKIITISNYEYHMWLDGKMPFITFRELQIWRLRQFVEFIWDWNIPEDELIATIFNITSRKASNLINDFQARFGKIYILPRTLIRIIDIFSKAPSLERDQIIPLYGTEIIGNVWVIDNYRIMNDVNIMINELRYITGNMKLAPAIKYQKTDRYMWVSKEVVKEFKRENILEKLKQMHPIEVKS